MFRIFAAFLSFSPACYSHGEPLHHRRRLAPDVSIIDSLNDQLAKGIVYPRFTITAGYNDAGGLFSSSQPFEIDVVLTDPSVGLSTSFSVDGGPSTTAQATSKFLIWDETSDDDKSKHFAILTVDEEQGSVTGLVQKDGKLLKLEQRQGGPSIVTEMDYYSPKDWKCYFENSHAEDPVGPNGRRLTHDHYHDDHEHDHDYHTLNLSSASAEAIFQVLDIDPNTLKHRRRLDDTEKYPNKWSYQVDLFIEVDGDLVNKHDNDTVNMPNTIDYINALITAASSIYEREVDTHLHVLHVAKTDFYDNAPNVSEALELMIEEWGDKKWHYTDPVSGKTPDLHHAILYKNFNIGGGGKAVPTSICNSSAGYGVTTEVRGSKQNLTGEMFWDIFIIMHEIGHNFGGEHGYDYDPPVDWCDYDQTSSDQQCRSVVNNETISAGQGQATIMSQCNRCDGETKNIGLTFGGYSNGGDKGDIMNWMNDNRSVPFSQDPRRVPFEMFGNVSTLGECVRPDLMLTQVGKGHCLDAAGERYSSFESYPLPTNESNTFCFNWCSQNVHPNLVAVEIFRSVYPSRLSCFCSFSGGDVPKGINVSDYVPLGEKTFKSPGIGAVMKVDSNSSVTCYKNEKKDNFPFYSAFGPGCCLDSNNTKYSRVESKHTTGVSDSICNNWCQQNPIPELIAFEVSYRQCKCLYDEGKVPHPKPDYTHPVPSGYYNYSGTGNVTSTDYSVGFTCYVYNTRVIEDKPVPPDTPTKSPIPKSDKRSIAKAAKSGKPPKSDNFQKGDQFYVQSQHQPTNQP